MRATVSRKQLTAALKAVMPAVPTRPGVPALRGVRIEADDVRVELTATDLDLAITRSVFPDEPSPEEEGVVIAPARALAKARGATGDDEVILASAERKDRPRLELRSGNRAIYLDAFAPEDWPVPVAKANRVGCAPSSAFADALERVVLCASTDEGRPILTGVAFIAEEGADSIELVATDSYRMGAIRVPLEFPVRRAPERPLLVPARALRHLARQLRGAEGTVEIGVGASGGSAVFRFFGGRFVVRTIEGEFPNWRQVMPEPGGGRLEADPGELDRALKAAEAIRSSGGSPVSLSLGRTCVLELREPDVGTLREELVGARFTANGVGAIEVAFNPEYLRDGVRFHGGEPFRAWFHDTRKPALLEADGCRYAVMPFRTR